MTKRMTKRELEFTEIHEEFAKALEILAREPRIQKMKAADGFRMLAWVLRSHPETEVTIKRTIN